MIFRNKLTYIEQMENSECALACLAMIMGYYNIPCTLQMLREHYGSTKEGMTFQNIYNLAAEYDLHAKAYNISSEQIKTDMLPAIISWEKKHFVILEKINGNFFTLIDPAEGRIRLTLEDFSEKYSNFLMYFKAPISQNRVEKKESKLWKIVLNQKKLLLTILLVTLTMQVFSISMPLGTKWITDNYLIEKNAIQSNILIIFIAILVSSYLVTSILRSWMISILQKNMDSAIMNLFMKRLFNLPINFFENRKSGDLIFRANSNIYIRQMLSTTSITIVIDILMILTYTIIMMNYSKALSLYLLLIATLIMIIMLFNGKILKKLNEKNISSQSKVQAVTAESINGILDIKIFGMESNFLGDWRNLFQRQLKDSFNLNLWNGVIQSLTGSIQFIVPLFIYGIGSYYVANQELTVGTLVAFGTIATTFITPIISLSNSYSQFFTVKSYLRRIEDVIYSSPEKERFYDTKKMKLKGRIELKNVSFSYSKYGNNIINNINLKINPGETIAIVGESGSGKSTLLRLILGLYEPTEGKVLFDDRNIKEYDISYLRKQIGSVLQESTLLNKTIRENLTIHLDKFTEQELLEACYKANILKDISNLPMKFETIITENGNNFSGGQRQRLQLARSFLQPKPILIFDEATSALDAVSESKIEVEIKNLTNTCIIVAHRLSSIKNADQIYVLAQGKLIEQGTHEQLIEQEGEYYRLYKKAI
ncbi:peptidase domain-containing ABC transporter [Solibacillus cecembensis]|uniref:peptidase domain-containing ABC transporter n=1 Tax=Solibacillus cecembensis TaxID=459347 RepID=UPI0007173BE7